MSFIWFSIFLIRLIKTTNLGNYYLNLQNDDIYATISTTDTYDITPTEDTYENISINKPITRPEATYETIDGSTPLNSSINMPIKRSEATYENIGCSNSLNRSINMPIKRPKATYENINDLDLSNNLHVRKPNATYGNYIIRGSNNNLNTNLGFTTTSSDSNIYQSINTPSEYIFPNEWNNWNPDKYIIRNFAKFILNERFNKPSAYLKEQFIQEIRLIANKSKLIEFNINEISKCIRNGIQSLTKEEFRDIWTLFNRVDSKYCDIETKKYLNEVAKNRNDMDYLYINCIDMNLDDVLMMIKAISKTIKALILHSPSDQFGYKILRYCDACIKQPIQLEIKGEPFNLRPIIDPISAFGKLKIHTLFFTEYNLNAHLFDILCESVAKNKTLKKLSFKRTNLILEKTDLICNVLGNSTHLNEFKLEKTSISNKISEKIFGSLKYNNYVKVLCIDSNIITLKIAKHICNMLSTNNTLTYLSLYRNSISLDAVLMIVDQIKNKNYFSRFDLCFSMFNISEYILIIQELLNNNKAHINTLEFNESTNILLYKNKLDVDLFNILFEDLIKQKIILKCSWLTEEQQYKIRELRNSINYKF